MTSVLADILTEDERRAPDRLYVEPHWYACYTRARAEKKVDGQFQRRGIESFLPLVPRTRQWKDRKKVVPFPLFPSYVFGRFTLAQLHAVLTTPGVSTIVRANGYPTPIADPELENVRRFAAAVGEAGIEPEPRPFIREGQHVRITAGPLEGVVGVVVERRGRKRFLVGLEAIGQGLEVDVRAELLEPLGRPQPR